MAIETSLRLGGPEIRWPVVVADGNDVMVFEAIQDLERKLEIADLESYDAFDATGQRLAFWVSGSRIGLDKTSVQDREGLSAVLKAFLGGCGRTPVTESVSGLLDEVVRCAGFTK